MQGHNGAVIVKFNLRVQRALLEQLRECARENSRSLNAELAYRLRASLEGYRR